MPHSGVLAWVALACSCGTSLADRRTVPAPLDVSDAVSATIESALRRARARPVSARHALQAAPTLAEATERMRLYDASYCGCPATDFARDECSDMLAYGRGSHAVYVPDDDVDHIYQDHEYDGYHSTIPVTVSNTDYASTTGAEVTVRYDFFQMHYSYSYDANPNPAPGGGGTRALEIGFYDCEAAYESASAMADALCTKDSRADCLGVLVDTIYRCSGCCDFFDECYNQCEGEFGGYYILEDDDGYEPTLDTSGRGDRCFGADDGGSGAIWSFFLAVIVVSACGLCILSYRCCRRGGSLPPNRVSNSHAPLADATVVELPAIAEVSDTAVVPTAVDVVARPLDDKAIVVAAPVTAGFNGTALTRHTEAVEIRGRSISVPI